MPTGPKRTGAMKMLVTVALVLSASVATVTTPIAPAQAAGGGVVDLTGSVAATFTVTPGVEQATVTGGPVRAPLTLVHAATLERIVTLYTDNLGQLTFQYLPNNFLVFDPQSGVLPTTDGGVVPPGTYRVISEGVPGQPFAGPVEASAPFTVLAVGDLPPTSLYNQTLPFVPTDVTGAVAAGHTDEEGYGYLQVRDGTTLSVNVRLPMPALYGPGPYPTVIQYSGYAPSKPGAPGGGDAGGVLATAMGFAYVGVNLRGSGCSGGVFDTFNAAEAADGYDVVETVARQPWVKNHRPGMMGISYSGITQLYVAATQPPSLAAITPLSVIEDPWTQQWPGGIYNGGFTKQWLSHRDDEAAGGAQWVKNRVSGGDTTCADNLKIRSQNIPFEAFARSLERRPADADARNLALKVRDIKVPTFLTGAWQDEQTGPQFANLLDNFVSVPPGQSKFTMFNGHHPDGLSPVINSRWFEFLSLYVGGTVPQVNPLVRAGAPGFFKNFFGADGLGFEPDRFRDAGGQPIYGDLGGTLAAYQAEPQVRVLFEVGASPDFPTQPMAHRQRFEMSFASWPPPVASPHRWYLGPNGSLTPTPDGGNGVDRFSFDAAVLPTHYYVSGDQGAINTVNNWKPTADGKGLAYETAPLADDMVIAGPGYVDLWFRSTGTDAPLEVVLSEVYADPDPTDAVPPQEVRVQHGLLRAAYHTVDPNRSRGLLVDHLFYAADYHPLTPGEWVNLQVPVSAVAHPFRKGSKLRIEVNTAGGDASLWDFESDSFGATTHDVGWGGTHPSSLVLSMLPAAVPYRIPAQFAAQADHPPCDWLRGQPCRAYKALANETVSYEPGPPPPPPPPTVVPAFTA